MNCKTISNTRRQKSIKKMAVFAFHDFPYYHHLQGRIRFDTANPFLSTGKVLMEYDQCLFLQQEDTKTPTTHVISVWDFSDIEPYQIVDNTEPRCFQSDVIFVKMFVTSILWNRSYWQLTSTMPLSLSLSR